MARTPDETALPLDDPRWWPIVEAHRRMSEPLGHPALAARDLTAMLADGQVRCMRRCLLSAETQRALGIKVPDRELVLPEFWAAHELIDSRRDGALVIHRATPEQRQRGSYVISLVKGFVFFVWGPDVDQLLQKPIKKEPREYELIQQVAAHCYPDGYEHVETKDMIPVLGEEFERRGWRIPLRDKILRALGRRKG